MKTTKFIVILSVILSFVFQIFSEASEPVVRIPRVSEAFKTNILYYKEIAQSQNYPLHFVGTEGEWSNSASSQQGNYDYFVIKTKSLAGGRILRLSPIPTGLDGIVSTPVFTDVLTGEKFSPTLKTEDHRTSVYDYSLTPEGLMKNLYSYGSFKIGSETFNVFIAYDGSTRYPTISITWGEGSDSFEVGTIIDTFEEFAVMDYAKKTSLEIKVIKNLDGIPDGTYLFVDSPWEYTHIHVEKSNDFKTWNEMALKPFFIYGDITMYPVDSSGDSGIFRVFTN